MPEQRALAAATDPHDHECLAAMNIKRDIVEHGAIAECPSDVGYFDEVRGRHGEDNDEARMANVIPWLFVIAFRNSFFPLLQIFEKIRCSSRASSQSLRASGFNSGAARTALRRKCFASRASFLHVPMLFKNSFFETASSALT